MARPPGRSPSAGGRGGSPRRPAVRPLKQRVKTARGRKTSSQRWLQRQLNDPYVAAAQAQGYRSRAAWKLVELDDRFRLLRPGQRILDLGAAPGGWTQVAVERTGARARILAVDLLEMEPVAGAEVLQADLREAGAAQRIREALSGPADLVLSDMAPSTTGHRQTDHLRIIALCEAALQLACAVLAPGGAFVCKVLQGGTEDVLLLTMKRRFRSVRHAKPPASRSDSAETYVVAQGFRAEGGGADPAPADGHPDDGEPGPDTGSGHAG